MMGRYRNFFYPHIFAAHSNPGTEPEREPVISSVTRLSRRLRAFLSMLTLLFLLLASVLLTERNPAIITPLLQRGSPPCAGGDDVGDTVKTKTKRGVMET